MTPDLAPRLALTDDVIAEFERRPLAWIEARELADIGGFCGWRTRISEARERLKRDGKGLIEWNRDPRRSAYRYLPYRPLGRDAATVIPQPPLFDLSQRG